MIPFTIDEFLNLFERYNNAVWPGQLLIYLAGLTAIALAFRRGRVASKLISLILAGLWLWMGVVYHLIFFSTINKAAQLFGALFIVQALIFIFAGVLNSRLLFGFRYDVQGILGAVLITYALVGYPIAGMFFGHVYPAAPTFGVPCPTTIFTFGLLLGAGINTRFYIFVIPMLWSLMGLWAAVSLGMPEDLGLAVSALAAAWTMLRAGAGYGKLTAHRFMRT